MTVELNNLKMFSIESNTLLLRLQKKVEDLTLTDNDLNDIEKMVSDENPVKDVNPVKDANPAKDVNPAKDANPVKDANPAKDADSKEEEGKELDKEEEQVASSNADVSKDKAETPGDNQSSDNQSPDDNEVIKMTIQDKN